MFEKYKTLFSIEHINTMENEALYFVREKNIIDEKKLENKEEEFQEYLWQKLDEELPNWIEDFIDEEIEDDDDEDE